MSEILDQIRQEEAEEQGTSYDPTVSPTVIPQSPPEEEVKQPQIDLSKPENKQAKDDEHNIWWNMPYRVDGEINQERATLKDNWYIK